MPNPLPKLERFILDTDVNAHLLRYLTAVGFNVVFANGVKVDIHDDTAILKWARRRNRIYVCHDKFRDGQTRLRMFQEVYDNGGKVIRIGGKPSQSPITSLGKILAYRHLWVKFFDENDGMVLVHGEGMKPMPRAYLRQQIGGFLIAPTGVPKLAKRKGRKGQRRPKATPVEQGKLSLEMKN